MIQNMKIHLLLMAILGITLLTACASSASESPAMTQGGSADNFNAESATSPRGPAGLPGFPGNPGMPMPAATPAPAQPQMPAPAAPAPEPPSFFDRDDAAEEDGFGSGEDSGANVLDDKSSQDLQATLVQQQRIIVRTVNMQLVVVDISGTVDDISELAQQVGGWVVSSDRSSKHRGSISIRVPANRLDETIQNLRNASEEVDSEVTSSQDVTDEYVDLTARLGNLQATEEAFLRLLGRADAVEDALNVQRELSRVQEDIERLQGRIKFLEETAAFSLINVQLRLSPIEMSVDAGPDQTYSVGQLARFRATFEPPEAIDEFTFTWDFGDGTPPIFSDRTAPSPEDGKRITTTITHQFFDDRDSPFIVEIKMTGTGDAGVAEGEDTIIATVSRIPTIDVFAGENQSVEAGEEVMFEGSFTRPPGLTELTYEWEFGDNSAPVTGSLAEGVTRAVATHVYSDHRPFSYEARLTIKAQSEAGESESTQTVAVFVQEPRGLVVSGWSAGDTGKNAVRTLSVVGQTVGTLLIWVAIFSPIWIIIAIVVIVINKNFKKRNPAVARPNAANEEQSAG